MSFLSLSTGDPAARELLRRAIRARYGLRPLLIESARFTLIGKRKGPLGLPMAVIVAESLVGATHWRWNSTQKLLGITLKRASISFDSGALYERTGDQPVATANQPEIMQGIRGRAWSAAAALLTPLTVEGVVLKMVGERAFQAVPDSRSSDVATIRLNEDDTVAAVEAACYCPYCKQVIPLNIQPTGGLQTLDGFTVPNQVIYQWADRPPEMFTVVKAEANPKIPLTEFTMS